MPPPSVEPNPEALILRPALCRLGSPLGVGMPVFSMVSLRPIGVVTLLPSLVLPISPSRSDMENELEWWWLCPCPIMMPLMELRGRDSRPSIPPMDPDG